MNLKNYIKANALDLEINGTSRKIKCPSCQRTGVFSVTRLREGILYNCFSASCGIKGFVPSIPSELIKSKKKKKPPKFYPNPLVNPPEEVLQKLLDKYELDRTVVASQGFKYDPDRDRIVMPIYDLRGFEAGCVAKALGDYEGSKAIAYWYNTDVPKIHYPIRELYDDSRVVVVEDILSATKINQIRPCVALLGTSLMDDALGELALNFKVLEIFLDPDAISNAMRMRRKFSLFFERVVIHYTDRDPKDMKFIELMKELQN